MMSPTIRVDEDVWAKLKENAQPLEDTPNTVLRRLLGIGDATEALPKGRDGERGKELHRSAPEPGRVPVTYGGSRPRTNYGRDLNAQWKVNALHALFHKEGNYYNHLRRFPGALFDPNGYVVFETEHEYQTSPHLQHRQQLHVPGGISSLPGYVRKQ